MASSGDRGKQHPRKTCPSPADFRALGNYGKMLMDSVRREYDSRLQRANDKRRKA